MIPIGELPGRESAMSQMRSKDAISLVDEYSAHNYHPLPIVVAKAEGVWVTDPEGNEYCVGAFTRSREGMRTPNQEAV